MDRVDEILFLYEDDRVEMQEGGAPRGKNKGTTKKFYDESTGHIYPRKNR